MSRITIAKLLFTLGAVVLLGMTVAASGAPDQNLPGETAVALGIGGAFNIRPTVALMAEVKTRTRSGLLKLRERLRQGENANSAARLHYATPALSRQISANS